MISLFVVFWSENASFCIFPFLDFLETIYIFYSARVKPATIILVCELKNIREIECGNVFNKVERNWRSHNLAQDFSLSSESGGIF